MRNLKIPVIILSLGTILVGCANVDPYDENIPEESSGNGSSSGMDFLSVLTDDDPLFLVYDQGEAKLRVKKSLTSGWTGSAVLRGEGIVEEGIVLDIGNGDDDQVALPSYGDVFCLTVERQFPDPYEGYESHWSFARYYGYPEFQNNGFAAYVGGPSDEPIVQLAIQWDYEGEQFIGAEGLCEDLGE